MIFRNYKKDTKEVPWSDAFWTVIKNFWANSRRNQPLKLLCFYCRTAKISFCWQICFINISLIKPTGHPFKIDHIKPTRCPYFCDSEQAWSGLKEKNVRFQFMAVKNRKPLKFPKATIPTLRFSQTLSLPFIPKISKKVQFTSYVTYFNLPLVLPWGPTLCVIRKLLTFQITKQHENGEKLWF